MVEIISLKNQTFIDFWKLLLMSHCLMGESALQFLLYIVQCRLKSTEEVSNYSKSGVTIEL